VIQVIHTRLACNAKAPLSQLTRHSRSLFTVGGWRRRRIALPPSPNESFWSAYNLNWFAVAFSTGEMNPYSRVVFASNQEGPLLRALHGIKTLVWVPHASCLQIGDSGRARPWVDFLAQPRALVLEPRPWVHIASDSVASSLWPVIVAWFGGLQHRRDPIWQKFSSYSTYKCTSFKPFEYNALPAARLSWMNWVNKGANGTSSRPAHLLLTELGLPTCTSHLRYTPNGSCSTSSDGGGPNVLILNSGPWELQDRAPEAFAVQLAQLLPALRQLLPQTRILIVGPFGQYLSRGGEPVRSWRTQHRALRLSHELQQVVYRHGEPSFISFLDLTNPLAAIGHSHTVDGTHFLGESILDVVNMLLNELLDLDWIQLGA